MAKPTSTVKKTAPPPTINERYDSILSCIVQVKGIKKTIHQKFLARGVKSFCITNFDKELAVESLEILDNLSNAFDHIEHLLHLARKEAING